MSADKYERFLIDILNKIEGKKIVRAHWLKAAITEVLERRVT